MKSVAFLVTLLFATQAYAVTEMFIVYDTQPFDGYIVYAGRIDRGNDAESPDGSTTTERIAAHISDNVTCAVEYFENQQLPDNQSVKYVNSEFVNLEPTDKTPKMLLAEDKASANAEIALSGLSELTYEEVATWVDGVTDLATAKQRMEKMAKVILAILKTMGD